MAKRAYIGVNGVACKVKAAYAGVDGVARKIWNAYIGVGGVARPCWTLGGVAYWGLATPLPNKEISIKATSVGLKATSVGDYALFGGGEGTNSYVYAYDTSLTVRTMRISDPISQCAATTVGDYAIFAGGYSLSGSTWYSHAFSSSLVEREPAGVKPNRFYLAATSVGNHALFGGGRDEDDVPSNAVDTFSSSLSRGTAAKLSVARSHLSAATVGGYALFAGGRRLTSWNSTTLQESMSSVVDVFVAY